MQKTPIRKNEIKSFLRKAKVFFKQAFKKLIRLFLQATKPIWHAVYKCYLRLKSVKLSKPAFATAVSIAILLGLFVTLPSIASNWKEKRTAKFNTSFKNHDEISREFKRLSRERAQALAQKQAFELAERLNQKKEEQKLEEQRQLEEKRKQSRQIAIASRNDVRTSKAVNSAKPNPESQASSSAKTTTEGYWVTATAYTADPAENGGYSGTASGMGFFDGLIACNFLPFGTKVKISGQGDKIFTVGDRMGSNSKIDIFMRTKAETSQWGRRQVRVEVVK